MFPGGDGFRAGMPSVDVAGRCGPGAGGGDCAKQDELHPNVTNAQIMRADLNWSDMNKLNFILFLDFLS